MPLTEAAMHEIESQIRNRSIPYDYDTKEYPIEVIHLKFSPSEDQEQTLFIPEYQRALVWDKKRQVKFIESLFLGVPIPPIFVAVIDETGKLEIIDGSQRIRTISRYMKNELVLEGLEEIDSLNDTKFEDLIPARKRKFSNISIRFHVVTDKADLAVRADIFDRLNSNVKALVASEIRKGAFANNPFYQFIIACAQLPEFGELLPHGLRSDEREELALRYFAYSETYQEFRHDVAIFLNRYVQQKQDDGFDEAALLASFNQMLSFVNQHFENGFLKTPGSTVVPRVRFESIAVGSHLALVQQPQLVPADMTWLNSKEFKKLTTSDASNSRTKLMARIHFVRDCLLGVIGPDQLQY